MRRKIFAVIITVLMFSATAHARTYKIAIVPWAGWSPSNVADAKGFWKKEAIDVKVAVAPDLQESHNLLKNRVVDIAFDMIGDMVGVYMDGTPVKIIGETNWSHGGDKIIVKKDLDLASLKGKKPVGVYYNVPSVTYFLNLYFSEAGLNLSETHIIEMLPSELTNHFIAGRFGIIINYDPEAIRAEREGNGTVAGTTATYEGCMPEGMMILEDVLKDIPQADLVKLFKGWIQAVQWSQNPANWKEYTDILNKHTFKGDAPYSDKDLRDMIDSVRIHNTETLLERNQDGGALQSYLRDIRRFLKENKMLKKDFSPEELFDNRAILKALEGNLQPAE